MVKFKIIIEVETEKLEHAESIKDYLVNEVRHNEDENMEYIDSVVIEGDLSVEQAKLLTDMNEICRVLADTGQIDEDLEEKVNNSVGDYYKGREIGSFGFNYEHRLVYLDVIGINDSLTFEEFVKNNYGWDTDND